MISRIDLEFLQGAVQLLFNDTATISRMPDVSDPDVLEEVSDNMGGQILEPEIILEDEPCAFFPMSGNEAIAVNQVHDAQTVRVVFKSSIQIKPTDVITVNGTVEVSDVSVQGANAIYTLVTGVIKR